MTVGNISALTKILGKGLWNILGEIAEVVFPRWRSPFENGFPSVRQDTLRMASDIAICNFALYVIAQCSDDPLL